LQVAVQEAWVVAEAAAVQTESVAAALKAAEVWVVAWVGVQVEVGALAAGVAAAVVEMDEAASAAVRVVGKMEAMVDESLEMVAQEVGEKEAAASVVVEEIEPRVAAVVVVLVALVWVVT